MTLSRVEAHALALENDISGLMAHAAQRRDSQYGAHISYSPKVFLPLTELCRDVCHYCTFAKTPRKLDAPFMSADEAVRIAAQGAESGCKEALFTLGEKPELRYKVAREALQAMGFDSTLHYVAHVAERVLKETGLLPHINAGCMTAEEMAFLRPVSASMGLMLESSSERLCQKGMPHYGSPDKQPAARLQTIRLAGAANIPFTSGILVGIGETRQERIDSLLALRGLHEEFGHLQEVIVQNFRAKAETKMHAVPEPELNDFLWTIAVARLILPPEVSLQAPPNLSAGVLPQLIAAGINDWGGVSPLTPDHVNPEAPWPHRDELAAETCAAGKQLCQRLTIYPAYATEHERWLDTAVVNPVQKLMDSEGWPRDEGWRAGDAQTVAPEKTLALLRERTTIASGELADIVAQAQAQQPLSEAQIVRLFQARGEEFSYVCASADALREQVNGDVVSYVVTRNINYTNICYFNCRFCAFSKGKTTEHLRGKPYDLKDEEIARRVSEAWQRGATEVCMQGGIHPDYDGRKYLQLCELVKKAAPDIHLHAFSPLEIWQGAETLKIPVKDFLRELQAAGLASLPGTAAEILDDEVRAIICPDKLNTEQWLEVMRAAHELGLRSTATIMFGHVERQQHWARHIIRVRDLQRETGGFTEWVPLPFVSHEAPMFLRGRSRSGPTFREAILMHAVARIALHGAIDNIQASWVKMGHSGLQHCLQAGANDAGGTLMNESITRAAGANHGEETAPAELEALIRGVRRQPLMRTTLYTHVTDERYHCAHTANSLKLIDNTADSVLATQKQRANV